MRIATAITFCDTRGAMRGQGHGLSFLRFANRRDSVFDLDLLAGGLAERTQIRIHCAGLADNEARQEAENGIVHLGVFGDVDCGATGRRCQRVRPGTGERQVLADHAASHRGRWIHGERLVGHGAAVARGFAQQRLALRAGDSFAVEHVSTPGLRTGDEREELLRCGAIGGTARGDMALRQEGQSGKADGEIASLLSHGAGIIVQNTRVAALVHRVLSFDEWFGP